MYVGLQTNSNCQPNWCIIQLVEDTQETYIIPGFWLQENKAVTAWPSHLHSTKDVQKTMRERTMPTSDWGSRSVKVILETTGKVYI